MNALEKLNRQPLHEAAARAYRKLAGERIHPDYLAAMQLLEWTLEQPNPRKVHGLAEANAEFLLETVRDRINHLSPKQQHQFLKTPTSNPEDELIPQPFRLHKMEPIDVARELTATLHHNMAAVPTDEYPVVHR